MGDHVLFFYGTLMAPQILHRVIHGRQDPEPWQKALLQFRPAILHGYRRHRVRGADYPGIISESLSSSSSSSSTSISTAPSSSSVSSRAGTKANPTTTVPTGKSSGSGSSETATATGTASVLGTVVSGLTDGDLHRLDIFEGSEYVREKVRVRILRESLMEDEMGIGGGGGGRGDENPDRHLRDVLDAAGAEFADEGEEVEAETYVWVAGKGRLEDAEWDFEAFKRDKMAWWVAADERDW